MNNELLSILSYLERDRGIDRETLIQAVEYALQSAARKRIGMDEEVRVEIDRKTCDIRAFANVLVTEERTRDTNTLDLKTAHETHPDAQIGDSIEIEVAARDFGRIAAQTAKQAILQKIRQAERENVYDEYKDRIGDIVSGSVRQFNRSDIIVDLGRAEAVMPSRERVPVESYQVGDRIRAYVMDVKNMPSGPGIVLSRAAPDFVKALFRLEVAEIADGIVEIKGVARDPGHRAKIAVRSHDERVDPVGACVGMRGVRVKNIVRELSGEKIDIVRWSEDIRTYATNALSPAKLVSTDIAEDDPDTLRVMVEPDQLSLAIGKKGQNVRLTAKLLGWRVDIQKVGEPASFEEQVAHAIEHLTEIGLNAEQAKTLVQGGFLSVDGILASDISDIQDVTGYNEQEATAVYNLAAASLDDEDDG